MSSRMWPLPRCHIPLWHAGTSTPRNRGGGWAVIMVMTALPHFIHPAPGEGWLQLGELALAFGLSALVGLEREFRQKSAGLRTYTLVGVASALFMLVSKYGFDNVLDEGRVVLDPSRIAAQVVSGIGFIGGGVIFMRRDVVRGLTTAASVWLTAALGMACGAGLIALAVATTIGHFIIMLGFRRISHLLPRDHGARAVGLYITYRDGRGLLRTILNRCTRLRFTIHRVRVEQAAPPIDPDTLNDLRDRHHDTTAIPPDASTPGMVTLFIKARGRRPVSHLVTVLSAIEGVTGVETDEADSDPE
ncbi:cation transporter MgtC/SapB [Komagataeibacter medellinensis NBRC 3288]|uniref:Protein MgtC n=2 Tax=Komagataeibacter medellinensis TaxID=1177712 RepID=G2I456_KOMMN|nr:cation transporter MgtC/SapB [Komagataeibacter medellinensis NBRC 3288]